MTKTLSAALLLLVLAGPLVGHASAQPADDKDFKELIAEGDYKALADKLATIDVSKFDPALQWYVKENIEYLRRGGTPRNKGSEIILVRGVRKDHLYTAEPSSGGAEFMLPNTIRYQRMSWDKRLGRIAKYFAEATKNKGGDPKAVYEMDKVLADHAVRSQRSVLISASTRPVSMFGPPFYIIKVAPERVIFNYMGLNGEREVLLPFWVLPHEVVAKVNTYQEVLDHPLYKESKLRELDMSSTGQWGGARDVWKKIEENIRAGKKNILAGLPKKPAPAAPAAPAVLNSKFDEGRNVGPDATADEVSRFEEKVRRHGGEVERLPEGDERLPADVQGRTIVAENGRPLVLLPEGTVKKFALVDELTHVLQMEREIAESGVEGLSRLFDDAAKGVGSAVDKLRAWEIRGKKMILGLLGADDPARKTVERSVSQLERPVADAAVTDAARLSEMRTGTGILAPTPLGERTGFAERLNVEERARDSVRR